jgi:hypothetical protein
LIHGLLGFGVLTVLVLALVIAVPIVIVVVALVVLFKLIVSLILAVPVLLAGALSHAATAKRPAQPSDGRSGPPGDDHSGRRNVRVRPPSQ